MNVFMCVEQLNRMRKAEWCVEGGGLGGTPDADLDAAAH